MNDILLIFVCTVLITRGVSTYVFLLHSISWLKGNGSYQKNQKILHRHNLTILIPVLYEQKRIIPTLNHFVRHFIRKGVSVIVITTQKEYNATLDGYSTRNIVQSYIKTRKLEEKIRCINYPYKMGFMAHQLNYALSRIKDNNSFVAIYNADSFPHPKTLDIFYDQLEKNPKATIFQQSAAFIKNFEGFQFSNKITNLILQSNAVLQTRWTFTHEYPRLIRQSFSKINLLKKYANAHVVGHGLIIQVKTLKDVGGFPTENITEDLFLGYLLRSKGYSIYPLPLLELADSPTTIQSTWKQKYVWFWGPMKYLSYLVYVAKNRQHLKIRSIVLPLVLTMQGLVSALAWLISGPIVFICLISPFITSNILIVLLCYLAVIIYGPLQYYIVYDNFYTFFELGGKKYNRHATMAKKISLSLLSVPMILFHSIPPYFSIIEEIKHKITGKNIYKPKTE